MPPVRRLVVKVGSSTVISEAFAPLVDDMVACRRRPVDLVVVTSGAVAVGMRELAIVRRPDAIARVQALAAAGQAALMARYGVAFGRHGIRCAQHLLTHEDISARPHRLNIRHTFDAIFAMNLVPIVNENDTVATEELRFGDNDRLAAAIGTVVDADLVILLSDIDAFYDADPRAVPGAKPLREIAQIDDRVRAMAGAAGSELGTGGMVSKLAAAELSVQAGIPLILAPGHAPHVLARVLDGEAIGTRFLPSAGRASRRRHWIGALSKVRGRVEIDAGAVRALRSKGSSLLPIGVLAVRGAFVRGEAVSIMAPDGLEIARGLVGYASETLARIAGYRTEQVARLLGTRAADPVVHRNDLILVETARVAHPAPGSR